MRKLFAHANEFHKTDTTEIEHLLLTPLVYGAINLLIIVIVIGLLRLRRTSLGAQLLSLMALLLIGGILGYRYVPVIGGIMIALGITLALGTTLLSVAGSAAD